MTETERSTIDTTTALALLALAYEGDGPAWGDGEGPLGAIALRRVDTSWMSVQPPHEHYEATPAYAALEEASEAIAQAMAHGRAWKWGAAGSALGRAELAVLRAIPGAQPLGITEGAGHACYRGEHPVQVRMRELRAEGV